jgi:hypothetical protein
MVAVTKPRFIAHNLNTKEGKRKRFTSNVQSRDREVTLTKLKFMGDTDGRGYRGDPLS